jgi:hypothetical protein
MTDQVQDQDVELDETEIEEAHDPKNAEQQSVDAADKAAAAGPSAKKRKGDKAGGDPMPKTKAGMINAAYQAMSKMKKEELAGRLSKFMGEEVEAEEAADEAASVVEFNYSNELDALVESEATLSEEFKAKTAVLFEAAVKSKLSEEIDRLEEAYAEELQTEIASTREDLVEKVDSYLNYVVESWMEENKVAIQSGLRTEIAEGFMNKLKDVFTESYVEVPESKVDLIDELTAENEELEENFNEAVAKAIALGEELETYKREAIIREASRDLAQTQVEKLASLVEGIDFEDEETFAEKVKIVKESHFSKKAVESTIAEETEDDGEAIQAEVSDVMAQYLAAIRKSTQK